MIISEVYEVFGNIIIMSCVFNKGKTRVKKLKKMLSAMKEKMFDWRTARLEKQVAQLQKNNDKLAHHLAELQRENRREITPVQHEPKSEIKRPLGVNE